MTNLINQITINGKTTTFLNYVNPVIAGIACGQSGITSLLTQHLGAQGTLWNIATQYYAIRFPVAWETLSGNVGTPGAYPNNYASNSRLKFNCFNSTGTSGYLNSTTGTGFVQVNCSNTIRPDVYPYVFGVISDLGIALLTTSSSSRASINEFMYTGWLKEGQYTSPNQVRNLVGYTASNSNSPAWVRVLQEGLTSTKNLKEQNPTLSCAVSTPGANCTDTLAIDDDATANYIGKMPHTIVLPSTAVAGKIYRNTGIDPDTGQVETDQKAYWMCVGNWGTDKIGMRVWTENII